MDECSLPISQTPILASIFSCLFNQRSFGPYPRRKIVFFNREITSDVIVWFDQINNANSTLASFRDTVAD